MYNFESLAMRLTWDKLKVTKQWDEWQQSEFTVLDQYETQGRFGAPVPATDKDAIFNLMDICSKGIGQTQEGSM